MRIGGFENFIVRLLSHKILLHLDSDILLRGCKLALLPFWVLAFHELGIDFKD